MTLSYSVPLAVAIITGISLVALSFFKRFKIEIPSISGSMISNRIKSGRFINNAEKNVLPFSKPCTSNPLASNVYITILRIPSSSSTQNIIVEHPFSDHLKPIGLYYLHDEQYDKNH